MRAVLVLEIDPRDVVLLTRVADDRKAAARRCDACALKRDLAVERLDAEVELPRGGVETAAFRGARRGRSVAALAALGALARAAVERLVGGLGAQTGAALGTHLAATP